MRNYLLLSLLFLLVFSGSLVAENEPLAEVIACQGNSYYKEALGGRTGWQSIREGMFFPEGTEIYTENNSTLELAIDQIYIKMNPSTHFILKDMKRLGTMLKLQGELVTGEIWSKAIRTINNLLQYEVITPTAIAGVQGTNFRVNYSQNRTEVLVAEGSVSLASKSFSLQKVVLQANEKGLVTGENIVMPMGLQLRDKEAIGEMNRWGQEKEKDLERRENSRKKGEGEQKKDGKPPKEEKHDGKDDPGKKKGKGNESDSEKDGKSARDNRKDKDSKDGLDKGK